MEHDELGWHFTSSCARLVGNDNHAAASSTGRQAADADLPQTYWARRGNLITFQYLPKVADISVANEIRGQEQVDLTKAT